MNPSKVRTEAPLGRWNSDTGNYPGECKVGERGKKGLMKGLRQRANEHGREVDLH